MRRVVARLQGFGKPSTVTSFGPSLQSRVLTSPLRKCAATEWTPFPVNSFRCISSGDGKDNVTKMMALKRFGAAAKEAETWLNIYSQAEKSKFAVFKVGGGILTDHLDDFSSSIETLFSLGLYPVIVHGAGPQLNAELKKRNIVSDYVEGLRVTTPEILSVATNVFSRENYKLVSELEKRGVRARPIQHGVFKAKQLPEDRHLGRVGEITRVDITPIEEAVKAGCVPVLTCLGQNDDGFFLNINADTASAEVAKAIKPLKVVYLSANGGLFDNHQKVMQSIDVNYDFEHLMTQPWFKHGDRRKLLEIKELLSALPRNSTVTITAPNLLVEELLTHSYSGTVITNNEVFNMYRSLKEVDLHRLEKAIDLSFGKQLSPDYFSNIENQINSIYVSELYHACAIITNQVAKGKVPYLSKFAVTQATQMSGLGGRLWEKIKKDHSKLVWRSRSTNPINKWYFEKSQGSVRLVDDWVVFWYGLENAAEGIEMAKEIVSLKPDMLSIPPPQSMYEEDVEVTPSKKEKIPKSQRESKQETQKVFNVGLIGARGYTGVELMKLIQNHPYLKLQYAVSRANENQPIKSVLPNFPDENQVFINPSIDQYSKLNSNVDVWVLAMPNGQAEQYVKAIGGDSLFIDLSADYRFDDDWSYGCPEIHGCRSKLRRASKIANPGCYATGQLLSILPIADKSDATNRRSNMKNPVHSFSLARPPVVFGVSGYSGAGTSPSRKNDTEALRDNMMAYSLQNHMHEKEVTRQLKLLGLPESVAHVRFIPHVASWFRGIHLTISMELDHPVKREDLIYFYRLYYEGEKLVKITDQIPEVKDVQGKHEVNIGGFAVDGNKVVLVSTIDNLAKGAATQCMQNINLILGLDEYVSILK